MTSLDVRVESRVRNMWALRFGATLFELLARLVRVEYRVGEPKRGLRGLLRPGWEPMHETAVEVDIDIRLNSESDVETTGRFGG